MKLIMENWRKFLKEETAEERRKREAEKKAARDEKSKRDREERAERMASLRAERDQRERKREEERAASDAERDRRWRLEKGDWTKEDKEYVLFTYEDEIEDFEETYGRKPRKMEIAQYIRGSVLLGISSPGSPLQKVIGQSGSGLLATPITLYDLYRQDLEGGILPLPGKKGFEQWAEQAEAKATGKPQDRAKAMVRWMRNGAVMSDHPNGIEAGLSDSQIGDIFRTTELTPDGVFQSMDILVKRGSSPEDAASIISGDIEPPTQLNPDFDPDQEESEDNPERIDFVVADPGTLMRIYKYYKAAGF